MTEMSIDELKARLREKLRQSEHLRAKISQKSLLAKGLKLQLAAIGADTISMVPEHICSGPAHDDVANKASWELKNFLLWLAESVDTSFQVCFEGASGDDVMVGGRRISLDRMVAMPLHAGPGKRSGQWQLSVPMELRPDVMNLMETVRSRGVASSDNEAAKLTDNWELVSADMQVAASGRHEPAIFLVRRGHPSVRAGNSAMRAIVVAQWPGVDFDMVAKVHAFKPAQHFERLALFPTASPCAPQREETAIDDMTSVSSDQTSTSDEESEDETNSETAAALDSVVESVPQDDDPSQAELQPFRRVFRHTRVRTVG